MSESNCTAVNLDFRESRGLLLQQPGRRRVLLGAGLCWLVGSSAVDGQAQPATETQSFRQFNRYFDSRLDVASGTLVVQAVNWTLSQTGAPETHHLTVLADTLTIDGDVSMPGRNILLVAREIVVAQGTAKISTAGATGAPSYTKQTAALGKHGAVDTGTGQTGGSVAIYATTLRGKLALDTSGGKGGDAQIGGRGNTGSDGKPGTYGTPPSPAGNGNMGMNAGKPGDGGDAGTILVLTEVALADVLVITSEGGKAGAAASHGEPGLPGATAGAAQGRHEYSIKCTTGEPI